MPKPTDEELLDDLRRLLASRGKLTMSLIEASPLTRAPNAYVRRFGSLAAAYERIGYDMSEKQRAASRASGGQDRRDPRAPAADLGSAPPSGLSATPPLTWNSQAAASKFQG